LGTSTPLTATLRLRDWFDDERAADLAIYACNLCGYVYDEEQEGKSWDELPDDWTCPVCGSPKSEFSLVEQEVVAESPILEPEEQSTDDYPAEWARHSDDLEIQLADIHAMAVTGQSVIEPMRTGAPAFSWDELLIKGAQLARKGADGVSLLFTGGLRISSDFAKALALGADDVAIGTAALIAAACQQYRICNTGKCPVGVATQDPELRARLDIERSAWRLENFLRVSTQELVNFARMTGNENVHGLSIADVCTTNSEISSHTDIEHV
jgi:rubredoxin